MPADADALVAAVARLSVHDHCCLLHQTREEQLEAVLPFVRHGLAAGERCVYLADHTAVEAVLDALRSAGVDTDAEVTRGALQVLRAGDCYLHDGRFEPEAMLAFLEHATAAALTDGFSALRVTGEMTWVLGDAPGAERLLEYEARLNDFFSRRPASAMCQYDRSRFEPGLLLDVIRTHPTVLTGHTVCNNPFYVPADKFLRREGQGEELARTLEALVRTSSAQRELERRVAERTRELSTANRRLHEFVYAVAHDARTPLRAIDGFSLAVLEGEGEALSDAGRDDLRRVRSATRQLGRVLDGMVSLAGAERSEPRLERVELSALASLIAKDLHDDQPERCAEVVVEPGMVATTDALLAEIVLANLIGNAWKFTAREPVAHIAVGTVTRGERKAFFVRDDGVGFDPAYAHKLFMPFETLHGTGEFPGAGVGLATVARTLERLGGTCWAESWPEEGATFYFLLGDASRSR